MSKTYEISGMKCQGCVNTVTEKLSAVKGVENVKVDLENKQVTIEGKPWKWSLKRALKGTKFELGDEILRQEKTAIRLFFSTHNLFENPFLL